MGETADHNREHLAGHDIGRPFDLQSPPRAAGVTRSEAARPARGGHLYGSDVPWHPDGGKGRVEGVRLDIPEPPLSGEYRYVAPAGKPVGMPGNCLVSDAIQVVILPLCGAAESAVDLVCSTVLGPERHVFVALPGCSDPTGEAATIPTGPWGVRPVVREVSAAPACLRLADRPVQFLDISIVTPLCVKL